MVVRVNADLQLAAALNGSEPHIERLVKYIICRYLDATKTNLGPQQKKKPNL
jgi:hypothetical protein